MNHVTSNKITVYQLIYTIEAHNIETTCPGPLFTNNIPALIHCITQPWISHTWIFTKKKRISRGEHHSSSTPTSKQILYNRGFHDRRDIRRRYIWIEQMLPITPHHLSFRYLSGVQKRNLTQCLERQKVLDIRSITFTSSTQTTSNIMGEMVRVFDIHLQYNKNSSLIFYPKTRQMATRCLYHRMRVIKIPRQSPQGFPPGM